MYQPGEGVALSWALIRRLHPRFLATRNDNGLNPPESAARPHEPVLKTVAHDSALLLG